MAEKKRYMNDLRVIDLRVELEKRKLDKTGVRAVLLKRLEQSLKDEGHDPEKYTFEPLATEAKTPSKRARTASAAEAEAEDALLGDVRVEDMIVQDDVGDEDDLEEDKLKGAPAPVEEPKPEQAVMETDAPAETAEVNGSRKREIEDDTEAVDAKKACVEVKKTSVEAKKTCVEVKEVEATAKEPEEVKEDSKAEEVKDLNNTDAEDSINLDIGEDELLNDDAESTAKAQKDGSAGDGGAGATVATADGADDAGATPSADDKQDEQVKSDGNTTSETTDEKKDTDDKDAKVETEGGEAKERKEEIKEGGLGSAARNLWVSGLSGDTRAKDLKQLCSKHGKVIGAKVVTNARTPGSRCYGYVTMASAQDAENCIKNLHRTELHGRMISVEKAKSEGAGGLAGARRSAAPARRGERRETHSKDRAETKEGAKDESGAEAKKEGEENGEAKPVAEGEEKERSTSRSREKSKGAAERARRERSRERRRSPREVQSSAIWKERDAARAREWSRQAREDERRRRAADEALRVRERRQRQEKHRLELEREKLRAERERIEREKNELLRLERERHKLEREKLELERLELKRAQLRLEEERRKRSYDSGPGYRKPASPPPPPPYDRDTRHKRPPPPPLSSSRAAFEAPPPPRFEVATPAYERSADKRERGDYKREYNPRHLSSSVKYPSNGTSADDSRQPIPPGTRPKEPSRAAYEARETRGAYRSPPPGKGEARPWTTSRYPDSSAPGKDYERGSTSSSWQSSASKSYPSSRHTAPAAPSAQPWSKPGTGGNSESWQSSSGGGGESRYSSGYEARSYPSTYQPPPPGAAPYVDRYPAAARSHYTQKY